MGNHFLSSLLLTLGEDVTSSALQDVFLLIRADERDRLVTPKDVFLAFQRNIRPHQQAEFRSLFSRLYGGPLTEANPDAPDDHGNSDSVATPVTAGTPVPGMLDYALDTDYFRFTAEGGQVFNITFTHDIDNDYVGADLYVRLHPADGGPSERLGPQERRTPALQVEWKAPATGTYYLSVESTVGTLGVYELLLSRLPEQN